MKGYALKKGRDITEAVVELAGSALADGLAGGVLIPSKGPEASFQWMLARNDQALLSAEPLPPVMSVQGARALASFSRTPWEKTVLAVMRPCEIRASIELSKLQQVELENVILVSMDCPGVLPLKEWNDDQSALPDPDDPEVLRPLCRQCTDFTAAGDLTVAMIGGKPALIAITGKGEDFARSLGLDEAPDISPWSDSVSRLKAKREAVREASREELRQDTAGLDGLVKAFSGCIGCRNCRTVCPICYCRLCFIDMKDRRSPAGEYLQRSLASGASRLFPNTLLFHLGRMAHMSLSCVACGMCEDACPSDIPIGRLVSMVSEETTGLFDYHAGLDPQEPLPLNTFQLEELHEFED